MSLTVLIADNLETLGNAEPEEDRLVLDGPEAYFLCDAWRRLNMEEDLQIDSYGAEEVDRKAISSMINILMELRNDLVAQPDKLPYQLPAPLPPGHHHEELQLQTHLADKREIISKIDLLIQKARRAQNRRQRILIVGN